MWREALGEVNGEQGHGGSDDAGQRRAERRGQHRCIPCLGAAWEPDVTRSRPPHRAPCGAPLCSGSGGIKPYVDVLIRRPPSPGFAPPSSTSLLYAQAPPTAAAVSLSVSRWKRKARLRRPVQILAWAPSRVVSATASTQAPRRPMTRASRHPAFPWLAHAFRRGRRW